MIVVHLLLVQAPPPHPPLVVQGEQLGPLNELSKDLSISTSFYAVAFSPDGRSLAAAADDATLRLWDIASGGEIRRFEGDAGSATSVAFSPDGHFIASASAEGTLRLWELDSGREIRRFEGHSDWVRSLVFSPDGRSLASASDDRTLRLWDVASGSEIFRIEGQSEWIRSVAFSPDGHTLASASYNGPLRLWDATSGKEIRRFEDHSDRNPFVAFSPDGRSLATVSENDTLRLWDITSGKEIRQFEGHSNRIFSIAFSPDGRSLASASGDRTLRLWDIASGREIRRFEGHSNRVWSVSFSPDGRFLASASNDRTLRLWDIATGREIRRFKGQTYPIESLAFSPDGRSLASASGDNTLRLWEIASGREIRHFAGHSGRVLSVAFNPNGHSLASASDDKTVRLWNIATGREIRRFEDHSIRVHSVTFSPDGRYLAASTDGTLRLWETASGRAIGQFTGHPNRTRSIRRRNSGSALAFSPDGHSLAAILGDETLRIWDTTSGLVIRQFEGHTGGPVNAVAFSPSGRFLAAASRDHSLRLWDIDSGKTIRRFEGHTDAVSAVAFSPDGRFLASASHDHSLRLWDIDSGSEIRQFKTHSGPLNAVAFSPDGRYLASASGKGILFIHSIDDGDAPLALFAGGIDGRWVGCGSDGKCLRYDDDSLLRKFDPDDGTLTPLRPPKPATPGRLDIVESPTRLSPALGKTESFVLKIRNSGVNPLYWLRVEQADYPAKTGLVFFPPKTRAILAPGDAAEMQAQVAYSPDRLSPRMGERTLKLRLSHAHGDPQPLSLPVSPRLPDMQWIEAIWLDGAEESTVQVRLVNSGNQDLDDAEYLLDLEGLEEDPDIALRRRFPAGTGTDEATPISFSLPGDYQPDDRTRLSFSVRKLNAPLHEWRFEDKPITLPSPPWQAYATLAALLVTSTIVLYYLWLFRHPLVRRLSSQPAALLDLDPPQLGQARLLLKRTRRLDSTLAGAEVSGTDLDQAVAFEHATPDAAYHLLASRLGSACLTFPQTTAGLYSLRMDPEFPINLGELLVHIPDRQANAKRIIDTLESNEACRDRVLLILHPDPVHQRTLHRIAADAGNLFVAPSPGEVTRLLLDPEPTRTLARLVSTQVRLARISPYQTGGGTNRESMFFGRTQLIAHIMNREPSNYLVVGGRQLGKSSLLKALERRYRERLDVDCRYLSLNSSNAVRQLARELELPTDTSLDRALEHLAQENGPRRLFLIDEADDFVHYEATHNYSKLKQLRSLSEEGRVHFVLAGYWQLYRHVALDYQSPLKNFGEILTVTALEPEACRNLATEPMRTMNLGYTSEQALERLLYATGQRANLISIACNEILKNRTIRERAIDEAAVEQALESQAMRIALEGWEAGISGDADDASPSRILVYAMVEEGEFTLGGLMERLEFLGLMLSIRQLEASLAQLQLAYIIREENSIYRFCVPLMRERLLARAPQRRLQDEINSWNNATS